jgi:hypothetical protein
MQTRNVFAGPYLDRGAHLRQDEAWFSGALADADSRVIPLWNSRSLVTGEGPSRAAFLALGDIPPERRSLDDLILLGRTDRGSVFAYEIESLDQPTVPEGTRFEDLRFIASLMPSEEAGLLGYARAMISVAPTASLLRDLRSQDASLEGRSRTGLYQRDLPPRTIPTPGSCHYRVGQRRRTRPIGPTSLLAARALLHDCRIRGTRRIAGGRRGSRSAGGNRGPSRRY